MFGFIKIKKQSTVIFLLCFFYYHNSSAQANLIPNPSFEDSISIPLSHSEYNKCNHWYAILQTPDYFSKYSPLSVPNPSWSVAIPKNCIGYQTAKTGSFYSGIVIRTYYPPSSGMGNYVNYTEAIQVKLLQPLKANHSYSFSLYYSLADASGYATNQLSAYFSINQFLPSNNILDSNAYYNNLPSQIEHNANFINDTTNWELLTGCFIAKGGEEYLSIGNFKNALFSPILPLNTNFSVCPSGPATISNICYIYIDDVSLYDMGLYTPASTKNDTLICNGTAINISANPIKDSSIVVWSPQASLSCTNCPNPIATPTTTTLYYLNKSICGASSKDSILVTVHTPTTAAKAGSDALLCMEDKGVFIGTNDSANFTSYAWLPPTGLSCTNCAAPYANPNTTTIYNLTRKECNVTTSSSVKITIDDCNPTYTVPNVFTPNYDGVNDTWGVAFSSAKYIKNFQMQIYNRWGLLIYATNSELNTPNLHWDGHTMSGSECTNGVYYYVISFDKNNEKVELKGTISLFR